ncbi:MAG TPA: BatA and WFA domain-containing protein [Chloroflexota bacterium]|nr:BatA and WFA domain-containing protein [Chloroflexota bacterium]
MSLAAPVALGFAALVPAVILLYLLKVRRHDLDVSSTFLWEQLRRDVAAHEPWQRLKMSILLLIQVALVLLLTLGIARPFFRVQAQASDNVVILLDASGSMQATDVRPNRFAAAVAAAREIVNRLSDNATGTVIRVANHPQILQQAGANKTQMAAALDAATVSNATTNMDEALQLALSLNQGQLHSQIFIISDGAFPTLHETVPATVAVHFIPIGTSGRNMGITIFSARQDPTAPQRQHLFVQVRNFGPAAAGNLLSLYADGKLFGSSPLQLPAGGQVNKVFDNVPVGAKVVEAHLRDPDILAADNSAWLVLNRPTSLKVLLVTPDNVFMEKAINLLPDVEAFKVAPNQYANIDPGQYNLFVFDGFLPAKLPNANMLILNPPATNWLSIGPTLVAHPRVTSYQQDDPLLAYVQFSDVQFQVVKNVTAPSWASVLAQSGDTPLLLEGDNEGRKMVILPFDLHASNFGLLTSFPIFVANAVQYLSPADPNDISSPAAGDTVLLQPLPQVDELDVRRPNGAVESFQPRGGPVAFSDTAAVGLYRVTQKAKGQTVAQQVFAINQTSAAESNLAPGRTLDIGGAVVQRNTAVQWTPARREFWPWVLVACLGLLTLEWYWYHRRAS